MNGDADAIFLQEARELVATLERDLLDLGEAPDNIELINAAFRNLHTLKGSGAMFGHADMSHFVHDFETAFDLLRQGETRVNPEVITVSLRACDQIVRLLEDPATAQAGSAPVLADLARAMANTDTDTVATTAPRATRVRFRLPADALRLGHDPMTLVEDLLELAPGHVRALTDQIPALDAFDPTDCVTGWEVTLEGAISRDAIDGVFMFHAGEIELEVTALGGAPEVGPATGAEPHPQPMDPGTPGQGRNGGDTMRVATERLDELMDRVGELVIAEARLQALAMASGDPSLLSISEDIQRLAGGLRDSTMSMRMVPLGSITGRFRRLMHDLSESLGRPILFDASGEDTELDKTMIDLIVDPLLHILRNAAGHGLESPAERIAAGKPEAGHIELRASYAGAEVLLQIRDDGRGLNADKIRARAIQNGLITADTPLNDTELYRLIFEPGFSTAEEITDLSGRGVGMDVVRRTIDQLRGQIDLTTEPGYGTTVTLRLPLTLAIIDGLLIEVGSESYSIPLAAVEECVELPAQFALNDSGAAFLNIRGALVPFVRLRRIFQVEAPVRDYQKVVVVSTASGRVGLVVDRIIANNQTVIKQLSPLHAQLRGFSGATILSDGRVALILDTAQVVALGRQIEDGARREVAA